MTLISNLSIQKVRYYAEVTTAVVLVLMGIWNLWDWLRNLVQLPSPVQDELVVQERRYTAVISRLHELGYRGEYIEFLNNRELIGDGRVNGEDDKRWAQMQYVVTPWVVLFRMQSVSRDFVHGPRPEFAVADFWDGPPQEQPPELTKLYDSGDGVILYRRRKTH